MKKFIYLLGIFTGLLIMAYGLKSLDNSVHDLARVAAGFILIVSHGICMFLITRGIIKGTKVTPEELKMAQELVEAQSKILSTKQLECEHDFPYSSLDCNCSRCQVRHSKVNPDIK